MSAQPPVLLTIEQGIATITLNRPQALNAIDRELARHLREIAEAVAADDDVRAVLLRGGERAFSTGADLRERLAMTPDELREHTRLIREAAEAVAGLPVPSLALIRGYCLAGGAELALACDLRFADTTARIGFPEVRRGIFPGAGGMLRLPRLVGPARAADLILSGRVVDADEALRIGLVDRVVPPEELERVAAEYLELIAGNAPLAVRAAKAALRHAFDADQERAARLIEQLRASLDDTDDYREGLRAFAEGRAPRFRGR
ncbi:enoyl-CoA hydratase-related protein [Thermomicrobiaceae bacterium CFH 74404]|uniref:Enoyl-CoA hydratase-related protein n=1 Tax=Thermalbibacter longus TaxID=2951981 RepID=A0AA42BD98_9BACT|nr:enoyl-CoA hydratase-related protein [Thermalbibacter longus]MCM8749553.1 enoyl-CoA hydratase-related protein [Thermalbibacter longus]